MSFKVSHTVQALLGKIEKGTFPALNLHYKEDAPLEAIVQELEERLEPDTITLDVSAYTSFDELIRELIVQLLLRDDKPDNCRVPDDAVGEQNPRILHRHLNRLLSAFGRQDSWICLILKHFEDADSYWEDADCAWMRELIDSRKIPACIVFSSAPISTVCEKPVGSSPLHNIFRSYRLEGSE